MQNRDCLPSLFLLLQGGTCQRMRRDAVNRIMTSPARTVVQARRNLRFRYLRRGESATRTTVSKGVLSDARAEASVVSGIVR